VLYSGDGDDARVFGGGFIRRSERGAEAEALLASLDSRLAPAAAE
jgi:tRNA-specific 2-thiouridylase